MNGPSVTRLVVAAPKTTDDLHAAMALMSAYRPVRVYIAQSVHSSMGEDDPALQQLVALSALASPLASVCALAGSGGCAGVLIDAGTLAELLAFALGAPLEAVGCFAIEAAAVSVFEVDGEGRWAVLRVNEGALALKD